MRTDETICLNSKVDGKQPYIEDRVYYGGGICVGITASFASYGCWVLYDEIRNTEDQEDGGGKTPAPSAR